MKPVEELSKRQKELLMEVWIEAHNAMNQSRQPFTCQVEKCDELEWKDLIDSGYIEPIPDVENRFIMTSFTDDIFNDLLSALIKY